MSTITDQLLRQATASTFEQLAFQFLDEECNEVQEAAPLDAVVAVDFHGPMRGRLVLRVTSALLSELAANMLGEDESRQHTLQRDALGEIANVVCGNLLPELAGAEAVFRLDAPQWRGGAADAPEVRDGDSPISSALFGLGDGRVASQLFVFAGREWLASIQQKHALA